MPIWDSAVTAAEVYGKLIYDVCQIQKTDITFEGQAVRSSLVSKLQKLRTSGQQDGKPSTNAALNGPQGRMAPLKTIVSPILQL